jgi:alkylation response protein AidB-like acyl-CoA dehydrogenase
MSIAERDKRMAEAEELLADRLTKVGFVRGLFFGRYQQEGLLPYPDVTADPVTTQAVADLQSFCDQKIDPVAIDREARIPDDVIRGLGDLGVLGACLPSDCGGRGFSQLSYCRLIEVLGGHCGGTALFVNAHHSIGPRAIVLFGTQQQKETYLPKLASGEWLSAFALTEPQAGSDAANVQTTAEPTPDGKGYIINGEKRWITNGGIAQVLTLMARTPVADSDKRQITAFIVSPDMPGFEVIEARMDKTGVRGSATGRLRFDNMYVPKENILGRLGQGLKIALTTLDFGRTTFGASCTGAAKFCLERATDRASRRVQFGETLGSFEQVKEKLAFMAAATYAMEACTFQTAALIDSGSDDYMVETAILKVFTTDMVWPIINETIQIFGGKAYFTDEPFERMMRDARINTIGEGANDVLRAFLIAAVGMRDVGLDLQGVLLSLRNPLANLGRLGGFASRRIGSMLTSPEVTVSSSALEEDAARLGRLVGSFGSNVERLLRHYQEEIVDRQYQLARVAHVATELYVSACVLSRLDHELRSPKFDAATRNHNLKVGRYYLQTAARRMKRQMADMWDNDDEATTEVAHLHWKPRPEAIE